jgi:hypothetical protein
MAGRPLCRPLERAHSGRVGAAGVYVSWLSFLRNGVLGQRLLRMDSGLLVWRYGAQGVRSQNQ